MHIRSAQFLKGVIGTEGLPQPKRPTIALFGRSNVGKSSVVNCLTGSVIARANKKPGRTTEINYYLVNGDWYLADLPGYGYAKLPPKLRDKISGYLSWFASDPSIPLSLVVLIVDAAIGPKEYDFVMGKLLSEYQRPWMILANKCDKGTQREREGHLRLLRTTFPTVTILPFSAKTGRGKGDMLQYIEAALKKPAA